MKKSLKKVIAALLGSLTIAAVMTGSTFAATGMNTNYLGYASADNASMAEYDVTVTVPEYIALRTGPGAEYEILMKPYMGQQIRIYQTVVNLHDGRPWGLTNINGMSGWVSLDWTSRNNSSVYNRSKDVSHYNNDYCAVVSSPDGFLNFRTGPGMAYGIITPIYNGVTLNITEVLQNSADGIVWGRTYYNGMSGWVAMNPTYISTIYNASFARYTVTVTNAQNLKVRRGPGTEYDEVIGYIPNGTQLSIDETVINSFDGRPWGRTYYKGYTGWISLDWTYRAPGV